MDLDGADKSGPGSLLADELNWLDNEIHLLDHRKGEAEKTLARILEETYVAGDRARTAGRLRDAEEQIREMERLHLTRRELDGALREARIVGQ